MSGVVVQKFGGSVLGSEESRLRAAAHVAERLKYNDTVVVVVSAMGRGVDPYATDALRALVPTPRTSEEHAALDLLMSCGEVISSVVFAQALRSIGVPAVPVPPHRIGITTTPCFGHARVLHADVTFLADLLARNITPVVPGFVGMTSSGDTTTLGRGGSDTTAAVIAVELQARALELYKDVGAVHDADPRLEPTAHALTEMSYDELARLAGTASRPVVHADAIAVAQRARLPLVVRGLDARASSTLIS